MDDVVSYVIGKKSGGSGGGTITSVKMNGTTIATSGEADLGTVITEHQDISGKQDTLVSGTNIKTINNTSILGSGNIDTEIIQYSTIPTASSSLVGKIIQYTGTTTNDYTNGYFYKCVDNSGVYSWENINVQTSSGGGESDFHFVDITGEDNTVVFNGMKKGVYFFKPVTENIIGKFFKNSSGYKNLSNADFNANGILYNAIIILEDVDENIPNYRTFAQYIAINNNASTGQSVLTYIGVERYNSDSSGIRFSYYELGAYTAAQVKANKVNTIDANCNNQQYPSAKAVWDLPTTYSGYDASKTQVLKNVNGTLTWVDE